jgi:hypothetical protein
MTFKQGDRVKVVGGNIFEGDVGTVLRNDFVCSNGSTKYPIEVDIDDFESFGHYAVFSENELELVTDVH